MTAAVVLMAYGSPERLADVPAYYADIRGGRPIAPEHLDDLVARYRALGIPDTPDLPPKEGARGGTTGSPASNPLNAITEQTRGALESELGLPVFTGMKHWRPRIADAAGAALAAGADVVVGLVLAPHYSRLSIAGYEAQLAGALAGRAELRFVESWHDFEPFAELLADRVRGTSAHVVFTAHSLPARILDEGDPYQEQLLETCAAVAERAALADWSFSYQSESPTGEPWLGPDLLDHLDALHERGVRDVLVCPVGFVSDHLEIRWDIDIEARERARRLGMTLARIEMPNADPAFVRALASLVRRQLGAHAAR
jgi:ferrochelatase